jgi:hypothetical protein
MNLFQKIRFVLHLNHAFQNSYRETLLIFAPIDRPLFYQPQKPFLGAVLALIDWFLMILHTMFENS